MVRYHLTSFSKHIPSQPQIHIHYDCMNDIRLLLYSIKKRDTSPHPLVLFMFYFFYYLFVFHPTPRYENSIAYSLQVLFIRSLLMEGKKCFPSGTVEKLLWESHSIKNAKIRFFYLHISCLFCCYFPSFVFHFLLRRRVFDPLLSLFFRALLSCYCIKSSSTEYVFELELHWGLKKLRKAVKIWARNSNFEGKWIHNTYKLSKRGTSVERQKHNVFYKIYAGIHTNGGNNGAGTYFPKF